MAQRASLFSGSQTAPAAPSDAASQQAPRPVGANDLRPDRKDKRLIGGYFDMRVSQQLKILAAEKNTTIQELVREFLNDGFQKHGKSRIA